ncbi:MAG: TetR/AcrR family transcriptional regulator [Lachnospiraceae bacterium]|nr:TetR/AcrR family transcriptional regulator [Lachnospiraceae bacterium]
MEVWVKEERETKEKLIDSARAEFMEKGYAKASLRKICANAGVTTGALYFFFEDKEDLFRAIVEPPFTALVNMLQEHFREDEQILSRSDIYEHQEGDHDEVAEMLIHHLYQNYDTFILLLTRSQGTAFEDSLDQIVDVTEKRFAESVKLFVKQSAGKPVNSYIIHWMAHMTVDAFTHLLTHEREEQEAMRQMKIMMNFIVKGFVEMISSPAKKGEH